MEHRLLRPFRNLTEERRNDLFWGLLLVATVPALRMDLLFPPSWLASLASRYALPAVENPFGLVAILIALAAVGLAIACDTRLRLLLAVPFVALLLADSPVGDVLKGLSTIYLVSAFVAFLFFAFRGAALSLPFALFLVLLVVWQSFDDQLAWPQVLVFVTAILVSRFVVEAVRQNLPLARDLGRSNLYSLGGRTLSLWWPMLILIGIGLWASAQITAATERLMYERGYVTPYCTHDPDDALATLPCPIGERILDTSMFVRDLREASESLRRALGRIIARVEAELEAESRPPPLCYLVAPFSSFDAADAPRFPCPAETESGQWPLVEHEFFDSLDFTVQHRYDLLETDIEETLAALDLAALRSKNRADAEARRLFSIVPRNTGMEPSPCYELPFVDCEAANIVISGLNRAYRSGRARAEAEFIDYVKTQASNGEATVSTVTSSVRGSLEAELNDAEKRTRRSIDRVHTAGTVVRQVLLLWLIIVAIKSILYVFARVIFDKSTDIDVDLLEPDSTPVEGKIARCQEVSIPGDYAFDVYYKANYQPLGPAARFSIPQWRASMMSRLRFGAWNMSRVVMPLEDDEGITFNSVEAEHLIDWELEEGEEVVFSYRNFVAMNDNIELRTVISLRVATLLLGRIVFHTARCTGGPGRLILRTRGQPATAEQVRRSIPAARLIAWNRYARFSVDSHLTRADIFLNGFNLRRSAAEGGSGPQGHLVVEADARDGGMLVGTLRFARNFLMPV